jgi:hypothetical protein
MMEFPTMCGSSFVREMPRPKIPIKRTEPPAP